MSGVFDTLNRTLTCNPTVIADKSRGYQVKPGMTGIMLLVSIFCLCAFFCGGCQAAPAPVQPVITMPQAELEPQEGLQEGAFTLSGGKQYLQCRHYDEKGFFKALEQAVPYSVNGRLLAAVSPHFLPVMTYTANILSTLAHADSVAHTIYVLAPNHSGEGLPLIVADRGWTTPFGFLEADEEATSAILKSPQLTGMIDMDLYHLQSDHSAATLMPFIKYYLPEASVVTILLSQGCPLVALEALSAAIYESSKSKEVFVLASVDFSHYLPIEETAARDKITQELIYAGDIPAIKAMDSGNLDSPEAMVTLLYYTANFPNAHTELMDHVVLPESEKMPFIGYSYSAYIFSVYDR